MKFIILTLLFFHASVQNAWCEPEKKSILLSSPVCQKPQILKEFLLGIEELNREDCSLSILFFDDNSYAESSELLHQFQSQSNIPCEIIKVDRNYFTPFYLCNEDGHHWSPNLMWRLAEIKDQILDKARKGQYDYLFLVDSDLIIQPNTLQQLIKTQLPIVCSIYWTQEIKNTPAKPQVWLLDYDTRFYRGDREEITAGQMVEREQAFYNLLNTPGTYEVGGVAGCVLIRKDALQQKLSYKRLKNLTYPDEDRYFSIRACALGLKLYTDTHYPALHLYRESDLEKIKEFKSAHSI